MRHLTKYIVFTTIALSLLLNIVLITQFKITSTTVIYNNSPAWISSSMERLHLRKTQKATNQLLYIDNMRQNNGSTLGKKVTLLCLVMTYPKNFDTQALAVKHTWGKRCDKLLFISSVADPILPALGFNTKEGYQHLWLKTRAAFKYIYENHLNDVQWFYKGDDDTYLITENLRYFLSKYNSSGTHFFGRRIKNGDGDFHSGGPGYVFTRKVLMELYEAMKDPKKCNETSPMEDVALANCLQSRNIYPKETKDYMGREIFHHYERPDSYYRSKYFSNETIAVHYIKSSTMYEFEYMLYRVRGTP